MGFGVENELFFANSGRWRLSGSRGAAGGWAAAVAALVAAFAGRSADAVDQILTHRHCVTVWTTDDGLPDNTVVTVARTPDGSLWIGTSDRGVARFNGVEYRPINATDAGDLSRSRVHRLLRDLDGTLWVSFLTGDIGAVQGGSIVIDRRGGADRLSWWLHAALGKRAGCDWFSTNLGDVVRRSIIDGATRWTRIPTPGVGARAILKTIVMTGDQVILGTDGEGRAWRLEGDECRGLPQAAYAQVGKVECLARDHDGRVWAGTERGLAAWDGDAFIPVAAESSGDPAEPGRAIAVVPVSDGGLWVLFADGLRKYRGGRWEATAHPWNERLLAAVSPRRHSLHADDREGGAWISTDGEGLWHVSATGQLEEATADPAFPGSQVMCMETDVEGSLWLGLTRQGLARVRPRLFTEPPVTPAEDGTVLARTSHSMCVDSAGETWLTEPGGGLWKTTAETIERVAEPVRPALFYTSVVAPARGGGIWLAPQFASVVRQEGDQRRDVFDTIAVRSVARVMHEDREGSLWIGNEYGLWRWRDGAVAAVGAADGFPRVAMGDAAELLVPGVEALADDGTGGLWIGLSQCELRHRDAEGRFTAHRPPWWDPEIRFWSLLPDGEGGVWIGTLGSGLVHFRAGVFRRVTTAHGLPDDAVSQILDDGPGHLWLGTFSGVVRLATGEIDDVFNGRSARVRCRRFGRAAGLPVAQCSSGQQPCCLKAPDGRLWFSTMGGVVVVDPSQVRDDPPPPVVIEEVRVQGGDVLSKRPLPLRVSPPDRTVQFTFAGLSLATPELVRYRWRMVGIDRAWIDGGFERTATYNQLPPGQYAFEVDAADGDGRWTGNAASVPIVVEPMVWETGWFRMLSAIGAALVTGGVGLAVVRRRTERRIEALERQHAIERERIRIARDLHDDLGASLTEIDLLGALAERGGPTTPEVADRLRSLRGKARETVMSLDEIVWAVDPRNDTLGALGEYVGSFAQQFFRATATRCRLAIDPEPRDLPLDSEVRHALFLAFKEAVNNVARHAGAEECRISLAVTGGELRIEVSDDGCGFDATAAGFLAGEGLRNIRERLAACGGWQRIESTPGRGTTVVMGLPVAQRGDRRPFASAAGGVTIGGST
jgi:signal transduction histidine kinase/ligand-binding sensor domain-containing protein